MVKMTRRNDAEASFHAHRNIRVSRSLTPSSIPEYGYIGEDASASHEAQSRARGDNLFGRYVTIAHHDDVVTGAGHTLHQAKVTAYPSGSIEVLQLGRSDLSEMTGCLFSANYHRYKEQRTSKR
jgi:hypothetical protein